MTISQIDNLINFVKKTKVESTAIPYNPSFFRSVEHKIEDCFINVSPQELRPEIFTVYLLIEHVLSILTGDVRYHEKSMELAQHIFNSIADLLAELTELIQKGDSEKENFEKKYAYTITTYLVNLRNINELLKEAS